MILSEEDTVTSECGHPERANLLSHRLGTNRDNYTSMVLAGRLGDALWYEEQVALTLDRLESTIAEHKAVCE